MKLYRFTTNILHHLVEIVEGFGLTGKIVSKDSFYALNGTTTWETKFILFDRGLAHHEC